MKAVLTDGWNEEKEKKKGDDEGGKKLEDERDWEKGYRRMRQILIFPIFHKGQ